MRPGQKRALLWQGVGWLFSFVGLLFSAFVLIGVYSAPPSGSFQNLTTFDLALVFSGVVLITGGRYVAIRRGGAATAVGGSIAHIRDDPPDQSRLEELGYHIPPEDEGQSRNDVAYEDGEIRTVCPECGENNDRDFDFCRRCSTRLPE